MKLRAKRGEQLSSNLLINKSERMNIHLIVASDGFKWKITKSKIVKEGPIDKWKSVGEPLVFMFGDNDIETRDKLDSFLTDTGLNEDDKEKFCSKMEAIRDRAVEIWNARRFSKERE